MLTYLKQVLKSLSRKEKEFVFIVSFTVLLITLIPLAFSWVRSSDDYFTGGTFIAAADKMVYLSQIEEARQGNALVHNLYTSEPQIGYLSPLWTGLGWFSRATKLSPLFTLHFFRIIFGFIFLYLLYLFISQIFSSVKWRKITFLALSFSSGLGIFTVIRPWTAENMYNYFGTDIWFSEGNTFLTLFHSPLFILSQICLLLIFWWTIARLTSAKYTEAAAIGLIGGFLGFIHPYDIVIIFSVLLVWFAVKTVQKKEWFWPVFLKLIIVLFISFLPIGYFFLLKYFSPGFAGWAIQNITLSPRIYNYMIGYGLIFILFLFGVYPAWKSRNRYFNFLAIWAIVSWLLLYAPLQSQRRLGNGLHMPMVILAIFGLVVILNKLKQLWLFKIVNKQYIIKTTAILILVFLAISSNLFLIGAEFFYHALKGFYITQNEKEAIIWFKDNLKTTEVILSKNTIGSIIPAISGRYVYLGHGHQTNNWLIKKYDVEEWFFKDNQGDALKYRWLLREGIDYLYHGSREMALGNFNPDEKSYLEEVYKNQEVTIYRIKVK
ncbi:hypothetical protein KJ840_02070 [Patescibacteria group bacterium]|nr:hypothetical protein [Patescibacteria group bacterium]